jgi:hypothetical protein
MRQGCCLSPIIYICNLKEWNLTVKTGIQLKKNTSLDTLLNAGDQVLTAKSEDELQITANPANNIATYVT